MGPVGCAFDGVIQRIEVHKVDGQLSPGDELIEKVVLDLAWHFGLLHRQRDGLWPDVSEVQVRRQSAGTIELRLAVALGIVGQLAGHKFAQQCQSSVGPAVKGRDRLD
jgi:hypothetical protein